MNHLEVAATSLGFIATWTSLRQNILTWPTGILSAILYAHLFYDVRLYADMGLQFVYVLFLSYGWLKWYFGKKENSLPITFLPTRTFSLLLIAAVPTIALIALFLKHYTNAQVVLVDASTTVLSLLGLWFLARKIMQTWHLWFFIDSAYVGMYFYKHLYLTAALNVLYAIMAFMGYYWWYQSMKEENHDPALLARLKIPKLAVYIRQKCLFCRKTQENLLT